MTRSDGDPHTGEKMPRRGCQSWGFAAGALLIGLLVCAGGSIVGLAVSGVLMLEGYLPDRPVGPATATITRVPTPEPPPRAVPTPGITPQTPTATRSPMPTQTATVAPAATDADGLRPSTGPGAPSATVPPTDTLTPIGAPARPATSAPAENPDRSGPPDTGQ
jgi:hypothetical protein